MSIKTTIVWLLVAIALGAGALLMLRTPGKGGTGSDAVGPAVGEPVLRFDAAALRELKIEHADGSNETVERTADGWVMRVQPAGSVLKPTPPPAWPVPQSRIESLLRLMLDARVRATAGKDEKVGVGDATTVTLTFIDGAGKPMTVRLADRSIAGTALIEVERTEADANKAPVVNVVRAKIDDQLHGLFRGAAPREWRDRTALPAAALDASRIRLTNGKGDIVAVGRVQGVWSIREPFAAPADPAAVQRTLGLLAGIKIADFLDNGAGGAGGGDAAAKFDAAATVLIEHDRRELAGGAEAAAKTTTEMHTLEIGGPADAGGARLFAKIDKERMVVIDARSVADLRLDAALFVWPHPTRLTPSEIGTIVLKKTAGATAADEGGTMYRRELSQWVQRTSAGEAMLAGEDAKSVEALLALLTGAKAGGPEAEIAVATPRGYEAAGQVILMSLAGAPLETIEVGRALAGKVVLKSGAVYRSYPTDRVPAALAALIQTAAVVTPGEGATEEIRNK